jgi:hypothetical protein
MSVILDNFSVVNTFKTDIKGKGKFAEEDFIAYFNSNDKNKGKYLHDVRDKAEYHNVDIDFVIDNEGSNILPDINTVFQNQKRYIKIEVKYSGPALNTGNLAFEMISHSRFGWGFKTKCDYMYFVFGDKNEICCKKRGIINLQKWINYINDKSNYTEVYFNRGENIIVNIMTKLDDMENKGVINYV